MTVAIKSFEVIDGLMVLVILYVTVSWLMEFVEKRLRDVSCDGTLHVMTIGFLVF